MRKITKAKARKPRKQRVKKLRIVQYDPGELRVPIRTVREIPREEHEKSNRPMGPELGKSFEPDMRGDSTIDYFIAGLIAGFILGVVIL